MEAKDDAGASVLGAAGGAPAQAKKQIHKIVLTGGPCGGKTTALARLQSFLGERGFRVFTVPEAATMFWSNGMSFTDLGGEGAPAQFQIRLLQTQMHLEDTMAALAEITGCEKAVLLCDRGAMDGKAYLNEEQWADVLAGSPEHEEQWDNVILRDQRYNAVFHLVTAANGAQTFYGTDSNQTRYESVEEACTQDLATQSAWLGHHAMTVLDNSTDFETKLRRLVAGVSLVVGIPTTERRSRKFLLRAIWGKGSKAGAEAGGEGGAEAGAEGGGRTDLEAMTDEELLATLPVPAECFLVEKVYVTYIGADTSRYCSHTVTQSSCWVMIQSLLLRGCCSSTLVQLSHRSGLPGVVVGCYGVGV